MPWKETNAMNERVKFIGDYLKQEYSLTDLCRAYGISRTTAYKWVNRYQEQGVKGLEKRSRAPHHPAQTVATEVKQAVVTLRQRYPYFGPKKLRVKLVESEPAQHWPAPSTIGEILQEAGLVVSRRRKPHPCPSERPLTALDAVNRVWSMDFQGDFPTGDGTRCFPLTVADACSRYLLGCQGLRETRGAGVRALLERWFREYGLPEVIRTDNGPPFASIGLGGLTPLSVWWIKLGILPERIEPGKPQQNGRHERLHRTLKAVTANPPAATLREQQKRFDRFREEYNWERPHEALGQVPPGRWYHPSDRVYPGKLREWEYPAPMGVRRVKHHGDLSWSGRYWYLSEALVGEWVGLEEIDNHRWQVCLGEIVLGELDGERERVIRAPYLKKREGESR